MTGELKKIGDSLRSANGEVLKYQAIVCSLSSLYSYTVTITLLPKMERLENSLHVKESDLSKERTKHQASITLYVNQLHELRKDYDEKMKEYENLMDVKVALDQEIATYRSLLEEEEDR